MLNYCQCLMREVCTGVDAELREFDGQTDDVHLLVLPAQHRPIAAAHH